MNKQRTTVDFGIDLGTTNSAISKMENGNPKSIRTNTLKDTMPSCVFINRRGAIQVGDAAFNALKVEKLNAMKNWDSSDDNSFIEFKRTMGSDAKYDSSNAKRSFTSIELSAEVLKTLKSFEKDENISTVVITVPAAFKNNQIDHTRQAGKLAGFQQVEIITEPEAAAWVYGLNAENKDGYWLVFDFGGGTFDAALLKVNDGIRQVIDTEGDNYLGGKNLDEEIVDKIIIPYLKNRFVIDELLSDDYKSKILRSSMKFYAEEIKKQLSFSDETSILTNLGDIPGEDDEGNELELDMTVAVSELEDAIAPIFQKSIDISQDLLKRNNLNGSKLSALILVGGPTMSPILRKMLASQICKPDTSVDPMTVVAKGAAIYASTIKRQEGTIPINPTKIQLEINFEPTSVFDEEDGVIKIIVDKTESEIPEKVFANVSRQDGGWSSGNVEINAIGEIVTVQLEKGKSNAFSVTLYDDKGNKLEFEPSSFNILQGGKGGSAVLPYNIGIEIQDRNTGKLEFRTVEGLTKTKQLPASGTMSNLKTPKQIRPGMDSDFLEIAIYQGEHGAEGSRAIYNHHVNTILIKGSDLPALLPADSEVDIELKVDINQKITGQAIFPYLDSFSFPIECETKVDPTGEEIEDYIGKEINKGLYYIKKLKSKGVSDIKIDKAEKDLEGIKSQFEKDKTAPDAKQQAIANLRKILTVIDEFEEQREWPEMEKELKEAFYNLEEINKKKGNEQTTKMVNDIKPNVEQAIRDKDKKHTPALIEMINRLGFELERLEHLIGFIFMLDRDFDSINWRNRQAARNAIERGKSIIYETPSISSLQPIVNDLFENGNFGSGNGPVDGGPNGPIGGSTLRG
ncbi:MAG: Hsp70 family protein [Cryomorphaceae bacterium]|nr:Hsp70 family protein [Cryomorphaceae bacterium]